MVKLAGYDIVEQIYDGSRTSVFRGVRQCDRQPVILKFLSSEYPTFSELLQFRNQYAIAKNLDFPGIVRPYSLESYRNRYVLVMEDCGSISLKQAQVQLNPFGLEEILSIAVQLADILHGLHQNRVIHKDVKPANILIHPESKQVKLIDFSIASLLPKETQEITNPSGLEGTLAYISPEQTGRMNRGIDYRSDFYSLGVTLFELLTGKLPFQSDDPMELVHCHIAKIPPELGTRQQTTGNRDEIPQVLSDIVMKLMAKNAEDRYQSTLGLKFDLENCLERLAETGTIEAFKIGIRDVSDRFIIPEKLYGREEEVQTLLEAFERVSNGTSELMLVAGFSGIGKTAVVNEVHKPIVQQRGYFIKGKFDQFNRNIPFSAFVQAFRDLMGQLLGESDAQLASWKAKILQALGENARVILEVIPELEKIIGQPPPIPELSGSAAQNRFNLLFQKFIEVFTTKEHPLVMFLDDLQWADLASLNLLKLLMSEANAGYLLFLGAYRDNEVCLTHPLMLMLGEIEKGKSIINTITLAPLSEATVNRLVADTLSCLPQLAQPLTQLVYRKTQGNPFFTTQFLKALHEDGWIEFEPDWGYWKCDMTSVRQLTLTDDVVEFMALQLQKLPVETQEVLKLAACIGNQFELETLAIVSERSPVDTAMHLWKALQEGFILPTNEVYKFFHEVEIFDIKKTVNPNYRFLHDRVQQAAYSLIPDARKQDTHYQIGKILRSKLTDESLDSRLFELIGHLNLGIDRIASFCEKQELAHLNLLAGHKAKASAAYEPAFQYCKTGIDLLGSTIWNADYTLALALHELAAEMAYLCGKNELLEYYCAIILDRAYNRLDRLGIDEIKIQAYTVWNRLVEALEIAKRSLQDFDVCFPKEITSKNIQEDLQDTQQYLSIFDWEELEVLPEMTDKNALAVMRLLSSIIATAYIAEPTLFPSIILQMVRRSLKYGNALSSPYAYACYGILQVNLVGDIETANQLGELALKLLEKCTDKEINAKTTLIVGTHLYHWKFHFQKSLPLVQLSYQTALEAGDLEYVGYSAQIICYGRYLLGQTLSGLEPDFQAYCHALKKLNQITSLRYCQIYWQVILNLIGSTDKPTILKGDAFNETEIIPRLIEASDGAGLFHFYFNKLLLSYLFNDLSEATMAAAQAKPYIDSLAGMFVIPTYYFYEALAILASSDTTPLQLTSHWQQAINNREVLQSWAQSSPCNHQHRFDLVEAEYYRILSQFYRAIDYYDRAISGAKENGYIQEAALANELAAKFYLDWGKEKVAAGYMQEAYYCYAKWGAKAKTDDLEKRYPQLLQPILQQAAQPLTVLETLASISTSSYSIHSTRSHSSSSTSLNNTLDFAALLKVSQAISSTIQLDELIQTLTQTMLENSGADRCALMLCQDEQWQVRAISDLQQTTLQAVPLEDNLTLPAQLIYYVKNTLETIVIDNLKTELPVAFDPYLQQNQPKSILCLPILDRGNLTGILYLENRATKDVFTIDRLIILNFLASQAAISLENARLYSQVQQTLEELQHAQLQLVQSEKMSALGNLVAGVAHEINNPIGCIVGNVGAAQDYINDLLNIIDLYGEKFTNPGEDIEEELEAIDLDYVREDLPKLIKAMKDGGDRITSISKSLRTFSRADSDTKQPFNLHEGIDSTVLILRHRLKANELRPAIEVVPDYGNLPEIACFPGQLNQVFMNILANAIDALDESNPGRSFAQIQANPNRILIRTRAEGEHIKIAIADNGPGIPEDVKTRIFDHLFTTKGVGKGTGLGLAIARQIVVEKHGGAIEVDSELGKGTQFTILLPIAG